jgi:membrane protease YdiL (CAAX protease family)
MKSAISNHPLLSFFLLAFILSWIVVLPLILNPSLAPEPFQALGALAGPTLAGLIVMAATEGRHAFRPFFARYVQWRAGIVWWLIVLFGTLFSVTLVAALVVGTRVLSEFIANFGLALSTYLITLVAGIILGPLWEEPGWRGFALPRLQVSYGPLLGTLILGVLWALWHLPGYFGGWLLGSPLALLVSTVAFSIVMTWVYNNTRGSILLMILLHSSSSATLALGAFVLPADMSPPVAAFVNSGWIPALTYSIAAIAIVIATRGKLSAKPA